MLPRKKPAVLVLFLAFLGLSAVNSVGAQVFDLDKGRVALTRLDGLRRFHPGDDARWAYPSFDDSSWLLLRSDRGWNSQGYPGMSGFGWYRFSIRIPEGTQPLALYFPRMMTSYEVYADGHKLGAFGGMPPYAVAGEHLGAAGFGTSDSVVHCSPAEIQPRKFVSSSETGSFPSSHVS
jgi:hypothetical protein